MLWRIHRIERSVRRFIKGKILADARYQLPQKGVFNYDWPLAREVSAADRLLWNGFPQVGRNLLQKAIDDPKATIQTKAYCNWSLARLLFQEGDHRACLHHLDTIRATGFSEHFGGSFKALIFECWADQLGAEEAKKRAANWTYLSPNDASFCLLHSWLMQGTPPDWLSEENASPTCRLNEPFLAAGLLPLRARDSSQPLSIDNLASEQNGRAVDGPVKLSVIMPAYNCVETIQTAVDGILAQTYRNIELIIVDDHSSDETYALACELAANDDRIILERHHRNRGAYAARNTGLNRATGDYVTVHDPDDWSHPQLFEMQIEALDPSGRLVSATCLLVDKSLRPVMRPELANSLVMSAPSVIFETKKVKRLGGWIEARVGADTELTERFVSMGEPIHEIAGQTPMVFQRMLKNSLTNTATTSLRTTQYGLRRELLEAQRYWHAKSEKNVHDLHSSRVPALPAATIVSPDRDFSSSQYDIVHIADLAARGAETVANISAWASIEELGYQQAVYHWPNIANADKTKSEPVQSLLNQGSVRQIVPQETCTCKLLIFHGIRKLDNRPIYLPNIVADRALAIVDEPIDSIKTSGQDQGLLNEYASDFCELFGTIPTFAPASPLVRNGLAKGSVEQNLTLHDWPPLIDDNRQAPVRTRRQKQDLPVVGRLGESCKEAWPASPRAIRLAGLSNTDIPFHVLGDGGFLKQRLKKIPPNWVVMQPGFIDVGDFVQSLDFFAYFPSNVHRFENLAAPVLAMASGVPVILPKVFRPVFGDAAAYAEPSELKLRIQRLWASEAEYSALIDVGLAFASKDCGHRAMRARLDEIGL